MSNYFNPYGFPPYKQPDYNHPNYYGSNFNQPKLNYYAFVNGIEGAKSFQVAPNQTMMLMDSDSPVVYMKTANSLGQATLRYFKLVEVNENEIKSPISSEFSLESLKKEVEELKAKYNEIVSKFESPKVE